MVRMVGSAIAVLSFFFFGSPLYAHQEPVRFEKVFDPDSLNNDVMHVIHAAGQGFPAAMLTGIREDRAGCLWMGSAGAGLIRFDPGTETIRIFKEGDGLQGDTFRGDSRLMTPDGQMWFGGGNGADSFYPQQISDNPHVPAIVVTALKQGGEAMNLDMAPEKFKELRLGRQSNFFEFQFAAINDTRPERNQYAYMLKGADKQWYDSGNNPFGRCSNPAEQFEMAKMVVWIGQHLEEK